MKKTRQGNQIKNLRIGAGLSQEELANITQLSLRTIQRIENNETVPRGDSLKRIAEALGIPINNLAVLPLKEDKGLMMLLSLSAFGFLIFPLLGIVFPLILWLAYHDKIKRIDEVGRKIIRSQLYWLIVLMMVYLYVFSLKFFGWEDPFSMNFKIIVIGLYLYNLIDISFGLISRIQVKQAKLPGEVTSLQGS